MEAPAIFKRNGLYYLLASACTGWEPNAARCAISDSIFGPWLEWENLREGTNPDRGFRPEKTFVAQSTYVFPVAGNPDTFIAMFDIWNPENAIDGRYVWLPVTFNKNNEFSIRWHDRWNMSV